MIILTIYLIKYKLLIKYIMSRTKKINKKEKKGLQIRKQKEKLMNYIIKTKKVVKRRQMPYF